MSTRVSFDLAGLRPAIESGDAAYCTALYADRAELRVVDSEQPARPPAGAEGPVGDRGLDWLHVRAPTAPTGCWNRPTRADRSASSRSD